jgi:ABC-2 type transport system permease protein
MTTQLILLELRMLLRERRVLLLAAMVLVAALAAAGAQYAEVSRSDRDKADVARTERERWLNQGEKDPHSAAHYSLYAFKPSPALAVLDPGVESYVGQAVWLEAHVQNDLLYRPKGEASPLQRAGGGGPAALLILLAPLVAFLLCYFVVARERDRGTLALALGCAKAPRTLMYSRAAVLWLLMTGLLVMPVALGAGASAATRGVFDADVALRLAAWAGAMALYAGVLVLGGLAVVMRVRDARVAMLGLFGAWVLFVVVAPRALASAVEVMKPLPSTQSIKAQMEAEAPAYWGVEVSDARLAALLKRYSVSSKEDLPIDERGAQLDEAERHSHDVFDRILGGFYDQVEAQDDLFGRMAWLSPAAAVQSLSAALAGSDFRHHRDFIETAERYRRSMVNRMNGELVVRPLNHGGPRYTADASLWAQIPEFVYRPPSLAHLRAIAPAVALLGWLALAAFAFQRACRGLQP